MLGYFSFAPKYLEYHFRMSPAQAGKFNGLASICAVAGGATIGGIIIKKLNLQPKHVALLICFSSFMISICYFFLMMVTCEPRNVFSMAGPDKYDLLSSNVFSASFKPFLYTLIDRLIDWLIKRFSLLSLRFDWSIDWLIDWLIDWSMHCLVDWLIDWLIDPCIDWLFDWLIDWLHYLKDVDRGFRMHKWLQLCWPALFTGLWCFNWDQLLFSLSRRLLGNLD